jgi:NAD(P)-dependent dehydrogenase (short-subunit alcohol dehydrogenase family)
MRLEDKVIVITGGNSGIGRATAKLFVEEGARVAITGRNETTLRETAEALEATGAKVLALRADATDLATTERAFAQITERFGKIDAVFANAGTGGITPVGATSVEAFEGLVRSNFTAAFFTAQAALPYLKDGGSIVFNGSVHATLGMAGWSAYAGAKAAIRGMVRVLASELAPRRIRVNQVTPGGTKTPIWSPFAPTAQAFDALEARIARATPLARMADSEDIARAVLYLVSNDSTHVTGTEIVVDGGATSSPAGAPAYAE